MRCLVTGGAGFIGSHLIESLLNDGHRVVCMDDLSSGKLENIHSFRVDANFIFANADITHAAKVDYWMRDIDWVFHNAASKKNICLADPQRDLDVNGKGTLILLQAAAKHRVKKFVHASTGSVYGEPETYPQTEDHPLNPCSYYGVSKLAGERYVRMFSKDLDTTILRYFHVYGSRQEDDDKLGGVVAIFLRRVREGKPLIIYGDGTQQRSFTHVEDVVKANRLVVEKDTRGQVYNCASGIQVSILELADIVKTITKSEVPVIHQDALVGDIRDFYISNLKLKELGLRFDTDLVGAIEELYADCAQQTV